MGIFGCESAKEGSMIIRVLGRKNLTGFRIGYTVLGYADKGSALHDLKVRCTSEGTEIELVSECHGKIGIMQGSAH